jgi:phosphoribosylformylglycinamidine synthase
VLGVVGLLEDASRTTTRLFKRDGAAIILLGDNRGELGGSEYLSVMHGKVAGTPPAIDLKREAALQSLVVKLIRDTVVESAHDCSEGGLAVAIAECTFDTNGGIGAVVNVAHADIAPGYAANATLFGESASRIVVSAARERVDAVLAAAAAAEVPAVEIGTTGGDRIQISVDNTRVIDCMVAAAEDAWATAIEKKMGHR